MLDLDLELVIGGYLMLEYSLSFNLFLCTVTQTNSCLTDLFAATVNLVHRTDVFSECWLLPAPPPASSELYLCTAARPCR